ncbi:MAG TPA: M23 family metallopeptidase [Alteraurantiacibacter sp.]
MGSGVLVGRVSAISGFRQKLEGWFPDREFFMRSQGQVRFITISSRMQKAAAAIVAAILLVWAVSLILAAFFQIQAKLEISSLLDREARVASAEDRVSEYRDDIGKVAQDLDQRQDFLEDMTAMLPADVKVGTKVTNSSGEAAETVSKVSALIPEASTLVRIEARQIALVERLTRFADSRAMRATAAIRQLGLDPNAMLASSRQAQGGPLKRLFTGSDGSLDPRFERLGLSLARMDALERSLAGIPQVMPADIDLISSGFGYRRDPFTGIAAMHPGLDFRGSTGEPILAAANGKVSFVGRKTGYGKVVEISHGNGLMTRYAHMSAFRAQVGQRVTAGDVIGAIGSTGRSTGPHLHFEVRVNNRAVNPRPFLETAPHVLEKVRRARTDGTRTASVEAQ